VLNSTYIQLNPSAY